MTVLVITMMGTWATWMAYRLSVEKGKHRRPKRGVWDFGMMKLRKDADEEYISMASLFWDGDLRWTGVKLG